MIKLLNYGSRITELFHCENICFEHTPWSCSETRFPLVSSNRTFVEIMTSAKPSFRSLCSIEKRGSQTKVWKRQRTYKRFMKRRIRASRSEGWACTLHISRAVCPSVCPSWRSCECKQASIMSSCPPTSKTLENQTRIWCQHLLWVLPQPQCSRFEYFTKYFNEMLSFD